MEALSLFRANRALSHRQYLSVCVCVIHFSVYLLPAASPALCEWEAEWLCSQGSFNAFPCLVSYSCLYINNVCVCAVQHSVRQCCAQPDVFACLAGVCAEAVCPGEQCWQCTRCLNLVSIRGWGGEVPCLAVPSRAVPSCAVLRVTPCPWLTNTKWRGSGWTGSVKVKFVLRHAVVLSVCIFSPQLSRASFF